MEDSRTESNTPQRSASEIRASLEANSTKFNEMDDPVYDRERAKLDALSYADGVLSTKVVREGGTSQPYNERNHKQLRELVSAQRELVYATPKGQVERQMNNDMSDLDALGLTSAVDHMIKDIKQGK